ncbi:DUF4236 domain-containing protein [Leucobacter aridicollis]|uniref:DUF4236 domain-containing protein n=1 Tax=Leucobacter aridicollis TaxID=283878 RepID=UPI0037C8D908
MGFRFSKSIKVAPGVRMRVSAKSVGISAGVKGARISANSSGRVTRTVGIPGSGISHSSSSRISGRKATQSTGRPTQAAQPVRIKPAKPSLMAPAWEKALYKQVSGAPDATALHGVGATFPEATKTATMLELIRVSLPTTDAARSRALLRWLFDVGYDPTADAFLAKYVGAPGVTVPISTGITATSTWDRQMIGLMLAEFEQSLGDLTRAIDVVEQLTPTTIAAVSLAELYIDASRWSDVVDLTNKLSNEDEASTFLLIQRGTALRELGYYEASREAFKEALRPRSRPAELRSLAWIARGQTYLAEGKRAMARKDFERVLAEDATYPGLSELFEVCSPTPR